MGQLILPLIHIFQKMLEIDIKHKLLMEISIIEITIWVRLLYLLKIDKNIVKGHFGSNHIVFQDFFVVSLLQKTG